MKRLIKSLLTKIYKILFYIAGLLLPKNKKLIVFESFLGKQYSDNPRAIYEYMTEHYPTYTLYWSVDRRSLASLHDFDIKKLKRFSLKWLFMMNRAKYWVTNSRLPLWIPKPSETIYVQTWHGTPLKKLAADMDEVHMPGTNTEQYKRNFINEAQKWDYLISPNQYSTTIFKRAFQFDKTVIESGYPRNDFLVQANNDETINNLKEQMGIPLHKKVILYAPTWRDNEYYDKGRYKFELQLELDKLQKSLSDQYVILLRLHYLVAEDIDLTSYESFIYNYSHYEDIRDLYLVSDILMTDYSSVFFDYAILKRPMLFYVYDIATYRDTLRGFYFDFEKEAPGPLVKTTDEIIATIKQIENNNFQPLKNIDKFYETFCYLEDGKATERVVQKILNE